MAASDNATCFVIAPLGPAESDTRRYSDKVLRFIVRHSLEPLGIRVVRADEISEPGTITLQVVRQVMRADIVVADLTGTNPNVMYELALRHSARKPTILLMSAGEKLPFDIMGERTIFFDIADIESVEAARRALAAQASAIRSGEHHVENPFSLTETVHARSEGPHSLESSLGEMAQGIAQIKSTLATVRDGIGLFDGPLSEGKRRRKTPTPDDRWVKIQVEFPRVKGGPGLAKLEIGPTEHLFDTISSIWSLLQTEELVQKPEAFTYLWDWLLVRHPDNLPLVVRGIMSLVPSRYVFREGERWQVVLLDAPVLHDPERFGLVRMAGDKW